MTEPDRKLLLRCWERSAGKPWEPPIPKNPFINRMVSDGYLRRSNGRCGFEAFKDSFVCWTDKGTQFCKEATT